MFVRCCIVLHNLILRLEGGEFDPDFRDHLCETGRHNVDPFPENDDDDGDLNDQELPGPRRHAETPGQQFRRQVMTRLFNSPSSGAVRRM